MAGAKRATEGDVGGTAEVHAVQEQQGGKSLRLGLRAAMAIRRAHKHQQLSDCTAASAGVAEVPEGEDDVAAVVKIGLLGFR
jgi:hypothetical protein